MRAASYAASARRRVVDDPHGTPWFVSVDIDELRRGDADAEPDFIAELSTDQLGRTERMDVASLSVLEPDPNRRRKGRHEEERHLGQKHAQAPHSDESNRDG